VERCRQWGQRSRRPCRAAAMRRRTSGRLGRGGGPAPIRAPALFPPEAQVLEEGERELAQERVVVQAAPAPALEVVETELVLQLLVHLLAHPAGLDQGGEDFERRVGRVVGEIVLALAGGAVLADEPGVLPGKVLPARDSRAVGHPYPESGELGL
jgi:hypothetical protein